MEGLAGNWRLHARSRDGMSAGGLTETVAYLGLIAGVGEVRHRYHYLLAATEVGAGRRNPMSRAAAPSLTMPQQRNPDRIGVYSGPRHEPRGGLGAGQLGAMAAGS